MNGIVIIGNGIAGTTCARNVRKKSNVPITLISSETEHFYARTALMYVYMGHMKYEHLKPYENSFWKKNNITLVKDFVTKIDTTTKTIFLREGGFLNFDQLVIATGSQSNIPDLPGAKLKGVQSLYGMPDIETMEENTRHIKHALIAGGGLIGIEMAEMLLSRNIHVSMLVREELYWGSVLPKEEAMMVGEHIKEHKIALRLQEEISEIIGNEAGRVTGVKTKKGETIACEFVGLTVGVHPNLECIKESEVETDKGVLVNEFFKTNVEDVFAIGDCVQYRNPLPGRKSVEQVWYTGKMHGETLARTLTGNRTSYQPGPWFNSAKFLDIEYQTYGDVPAVMKEDHQTFFWKHPTKHIFFRAIFKKADHSLAGINCLGMRLRHELFNQWLLGKVTVEYVIENLSEANFDPEFYRKHEPAILAKFNTDFSANLSKKRKGWRRLITV